MKIIETKRAINIEINIGIGLRVNLVSITRVFLPYSTRADDRYLEILIKNQKDRSAYSRVF
jgi:hypothetical protein